MKIPIILKTVCIEHWSKFCSPSPQKEVSIWADLTFHRYSISTWNIVYDIWKLRDYYIQQIQWVQCGIRSIFTQHTFPTFKVQQENKSISSWTWSMKEFEYWTNTHYWHLITYYKIHDLLMKYLIVLIQDHYQILVKSGSN